VAVVTLVLVELIIGEFLEARLEHQHQQMENQAQVEVVVFFQLLLESMAVMVEMEFQAAAEHLVMRQVHKQILVVTAVQDLWEVEEVLGQPQLEHAQVVQAETE